MTALLNGIGTERRLAFIGAALLLAAGCGTSGTAGELLLAGPTTNIMVSIPQGWHQVINSANPATPEMVTPSSCLGAAEIGCATGLARIGTVRSRSVEEAAEAVGDVVTAVASGPTTPDPQGYTEYSVVMAWIKDSRGGPDAEVIDKIVNSTLVHGGIPAP